MSNAKTGQETTGIPEQIIENFLSQLNTEKVSPHIVARLKKTILEENDTSEAAIKAALTANNEEA